jgi:hypothetical protein
MASIDCLRLLYSLSINRLALPTISPTRIHGHSNINLSRLPAHSAIGLCLHHLALLATDSFSWHSTLPSSDFVSFPSALQAADSFLKHQLSTTKHCVFSGQPLRPSSSQHTSSFLLDQSISRFSQHSTYFDQQLAFFFSLLAPRMINLF